ncbi:hypothetical protein L1987_46902 [Smallanthus sonchifolius]|uniref:Uncharacterized protein n=1 Tax=Smallanthus sonchifolius TaxID=185202 RepID=A0ACB9G240_9ASTR|nr:hypothetical protein L1987_46902 [Smallanthus sonchifolius]
MNPISSPYYNDDPFAIIPDSVTPEYHPQSDDTSNQWMEAGSDFSNWNTYAPLLQGNNETESSRTHPNMSAEEDPSEEESYHNYVSEPFYHRPFKTYFQAPPEYQNAYNDIMVGVRSEREQMLLNRIAELEREKAEVEARNALLVQAFEEKNFRNF